MCSIVLYGKDDELLFRLTVGETGGPLAGVVVPKDVLELSLVLLPDAVVAEEGFGTIRTVILTPLK